MKSKSVKAVNYTAPSTSGCSFVAVTVNYLPSLVKSISERLT